jgi:hypothetical protein
MWCTPLGGLQVRSTPSEEEEEEEEEDDDDMQLQGELLPAIKGAVGQPSPIAVKTNPMTASFRSALS